MRNGLPGFEGEGSDVLESVADDQRNGGLNGVSSSEGEGSDVLDSLLKLGDKIAGIKVEDGLGEDGSVIIDLGDLHTVLEGLDVKLLEEGSFGSLDLLSLGADLEVFGDFDLSLDDLGGDVECVEEVDLGGIETSGTSRGGEIDGGDDSDSGFSGHLVGFDLDSELMDGGIAEDDCHLFLDEGGEDGKFWDLASELLFEGFELILGDAFNAHLDHLLDEGLSRVGGTFLEMTRMLLYARRAFLICWI